MTRSLTLVVILLAGAALLLRWPGLNRRPMHNDEGVNAVKFGELWERKAINTTPMNTTALLFSTPLWPSHA